MTEPPVLLAWTLERAKRYLRDAGHCVHVCDITPAGADERYTELRVVKQTADENGAIHLTVAAFIPRDAIRVTRVGLHQAPPAGVYAVEMHLAEMADLSLGALGPMQLQPGLYVYVGSARKGLALRLARHATGRKPCRWHVDYLSSVAPADRALVWPWAEGRECLLASATAGLGEVVPRFGAGDCRCQGHLVRLDATRQQWWRGLSDVPPPLWIITPLSTEPEAPNS